MGAAVSRINWLSVEELKKINKNLKVTRTREEDTGHVAVWTVAGPEPGKRLRLKQYFPPFSEREGGREGLRALLAGETRFDDNILKRIFKYLTHPHMLAKKTAEPKYVRMYEGILDPKLRASLIDPDQAVREPGNRSLGPAMRPRWEVVFEGHTKYVDTLSVPIKRHRSMPRDFISPMIDLGAHINSDYQRLAVACGKAFEDVVYKPLLWEAFDAYTGRQKERLVEQLGSREEAMWQLVANRQIFRRRYANLSVIHRPNEEGGPLINAVRKRAGITLIPWPEPVDQDFPGRSLWQPVDRRVFI